MARQGSVVASMTLLSRISGLMRDVVLSYLFGASQLADMFFVAFRIPNFSVDYSQKVPLIRPLCRC